VTDYVFEPEGYRGRIREEVWGYDELQERVAQATLGLEAHRILDLGVGTGEAARRVLALHPAARLTGTDVSPAMLEQARAELPTDRVDELVVSRLEDALPAGPFDLVVSVLAVHHLDSEAKADLFRRVAAVLRRGGRFVLGDAVVPDSPEDAVISLTEGFDLPDPVDAQVAWLRDAGLAARAEWADRDLAVLVAELL
jgi:tRNA (cmo5U34)-methyltransferase